MLRKTFRAIAALQQESFAFRDARQLLLQIARLSREHQRRKGRKLFFDISQGLPVRINRDLLYRLFSPTIGRPALGHFTHYSSIWPALYTTAPCPRQLFQSVRLFRAYS